MSRRSNYSAVISSTELLSAPTFINEGTYLYKLDERGELCHDGVKQKSKISTIIGDSKRFVRGIKKIYSYDTRFKPTDTIFLVYFADYGAPKFFHEYCQKVKQQAKELRSNPNEPQLIYAPIDTNRVERTYQDLIKEISRVGAQPVLLTIAQPDLSTAMNRWQTTNNSDSHCEQYCQYLNDTRDCFNKTFYQLHASMKTPVIEIDNLIGCNDERMKVLQDDGIRLNEQGYNLLIQQLKKIFI